MPPMLTQERNRSIRATVLFPPFFSRIPCRKPSFRDFFSIDVPPPSPKNAIGENAFENSLFRVILKGNNDRYRAFQI